MRCHRLRPPQNRLFNMCSKVLEKDFEHNVLKYLERAPNFNDSSCCVFEAEAAFLFATLSAIHH